MLRNRLNWWRHELRIETKKEFAELLGVRDEQLNRWISQKPQPNIESAWQIRNVLRDKFPDKCANLTIDDLFEECKDAE